MKKRYLSLDRQIEMMESESQVTDLVLFFLAALMVCCLTMEIIGRIC